MEVDQVDYSRTVGDQWEDRNLTAVDQSSYWGDAGAGAGAE